MSLTELLLIRHGETDWNRGGRFQGHADPPLNETGREQARALAQELADAQIDVVYTSDLARARQTAEIDAGEWQGLTWPEIEERFPEGARTWHDRGHGWDTGETYEQLGERILTALRRIAADHPAQRVLVVGHGGTIRATRAFLKDTSVAVSRRKSRGIANCEVFRVVTEDGGFRRID